MQYILITYYSPLPTPPICSPLLIQPTLCSLSLLNNTSQNKRTKKKPQIKENTKIKPESVLYWPALECS